MVSFTLIHGERLYDIGLILYTLESLTTIPNGRLTFLYLALASP